MGLGVIGVEVEADAPVQPGGFETDVERVGGFPAEFGVAQAAGDQAVMDLTAVEFVGLPTALATLDGGEGPEGGQALVAIAAPGSLDLEILPAVFPGPEGLVAGRPGGTEGEEIAPFPVGAEEGRSVPAVGGRGGIAPVVGIHHAGQITDIARAASVLAELDELGLLEAGDTEQGVAVGSEVGPRRLVHIVGGVVPRGDQGHVDAVPVEVPCVTQDGVQDVTVGLLMGDGAVRPGEVPLKGRRGVTGVVSIGPFLHVIVLIGEVFRTAVDVVQQVIDPEGQAFDPGTPDLDRGVEPVGVAVILIVPVGRVRLPERILVAVALRDGIFLKQGGTGTVRLAVGADEIGGADVGGDAGIVLAGVGAVHAEAQPVRHVRAELAEQGGTGEIVTDDDALVGSPGSGEIVIDFLAGARDAKLVILLETDAGGEIQPVDGLAGFEIGPFLRRHPGQVRGLGAVHDSEDVILRSQHPGLVGPGLQGCGGVEGDGRLLAGAFFRRDQDDAVRGTGTEGGRAAGILQDVDRGDVGRVDLIDAADVDYAIQDYQRCVGAGNGALATHLHRRLAAGIVDGADIQAGHVALQRFQGVGVVHQGDGGVLDAHGRDAADEVFPLGGAVTDDDHFVQGLDIIPEGDADLAASLEGHVGVEVAEHRNPEGGVGGDFFQDGHAVKVRNGSVARTGDLHVCAG